MSNVWELVAIERGALADDLEGLTDAQWNTPSLCQGWSVRDIVAHLTAAGSTGPGAFVALAMTGRGDYVSDLTGPGVETLRGRTA